LELVFSAPNIALEVGNVEATARGSRVSGERQSSGKFRHRAVLPDYPVKEENMTMLERFTNNLRDELNTNPGWTAMGIIIAALIIGLFISSKLPN
jgi:hypothetical protein